MDVCACRPWIDLVRARYVIRRRGVAPAMYGRPNEMLQVEDFLNQTRRFLGFLSLLVTLGPGAPFTFIPRYSQPLLYLHGRGMKMPISR